MAPRLNISISKEYLIEEYIKKNRKQAEIAEDLGISQTMISYHLKRSGIKKGDLTGREFGSWKVLEKDKNVKRGWLCVCKCGAEFSVLSYHLKSGDSSKCRKCVSRFPEDITGQKHGKWTVLKYKGTRKGITAWLCECGKIDTKTKSDLYSSTQCKRCSVWTGYKNISGSYWASIKRYAVKRKKKFEISIEYIWELYIKQDKKCALTRVPLTFGKSTNDGKNQSASLDRIDSSKGYIEGNIQWVHKDINFMKQAFSQEHFIHLCTLVHNNIINSLERIKKYD